MTAPDLEIQLLAAMQPEIPCANHDADYGYCAACEGDAERILAALLPLVRAWGLEQQKTALEEAADGIQALHPGEEKNSVVWLRARAEAIGQGGSTEAVPYCGKSEPHTAHGTGNGRWCGGNKPGKFSGAVLEP